MVINGWMMSATWSFGHPNLTWRETPLKMSERQSAWFATPCQLSFQCYCRRFTDPQKHLQFLNELWTEVKEQFGLNDDLVCSE